VETDSQELVSLWRARKEGRSEISAILKEVQKISATFSSFVVTHVRRSANIAAHVFDSNTPHTSLAHVWVNQPLASCRRAC
jgi:hypothetical protein